MELAINTIMIMVVHLVLVIIVLILVERTGANLNDASGGQDNGLVGLHEVETVLKMF